jgi:hypothetical protein
MGLTPVGVQQDRVSESSTRAAESPGKRRVVALVVLAGGYLARKRTHADPGKEGLGGIPRSAPFYALASTPLWGGWPWRWTRPPMIPAVTRSFFLPTLFTRKSEHQWGHRQGQEKRGLNRKAGPPVHEELVDRQFTAAEPNTVWLTDIERHEALLNRAVVEGHRGRSVAAGR